MSEYSLQQSYLGLVVDLSPQVTEDSVTFDFSQLSVTWFVLVFQTLNVEQIIMPDISHTH